MIQEFVNYMQFNRGYSEGTCDGYRRDLHAFVAWLGEYGRCQRWSQLTADDVDDYVTDMSTNGVAAATIKRRVSAIRTLLTWQRQMRMRDDNPAQYVSTPKKWKRLPVTIDGDAITATVYDKRIDETTRAMIAIMAETGMRISEVLAINWADIDREANAIRVHGKGKKERTVYYGRWTSAYISKHHMSDSATMFTMTNRNARHHVHMALSRHTANRDGSCHQLRHSFACELTKNGADLLTIATLMGHESTQTTEIYAQASASQIKAKYEQLKPMYDGRK